jgi:hypothetical protein
MKYHTALKSEFAAQPVQRISVGHSVSFQHDIFQGLPQEYAVCDILYADLPWADGFEAFEHRAGKSGRSYEAFLKAVGDIIQSVNTPVVVTTGKKGAKHLPTPDASYPTVLNGAPAVALAYRLTLSKHLTTSGIIDELVNRYSCLGNFCCGYGRTVKAFHDAGKRFVASDYNAKCIGVIGEWFK